jgi:hypothetical protein
MTPLEKMWVSFYAIGLLIAASLLVTFARKKTKGVIRFILTLISFLLLVFGVVLGVISMF